MTCPPVSPGVPLVTGGASPRPIGGTHHHSHPASAPPGGRGTGDAQTCPHCGSRVIERGRCLDCGRLTQ